MLRPIATTMFLLSFAIGAAQAADGIPAHIQAAVADAARPEADTARDAGRKPAEVVAFAGLKVGDKVGEISPGGGYFTRIFAKTVGPQGKVYGMISEATLARRPEAGDAVNGIASNNPNVTLHPISLEKLSAPEPLDLVWTSLNYHDFRNSGENVTAGMNKSIFAALKPGGAYIVIDHAAANGSGTRDGQTLHRIDPELVKQEVTAAGFVLEAESQALDNPADDHTTKVFEGELRGQTDQFVLLFRKPQ